MGPLFCVTTCGSNGPMSPWPIAGYGTAAATVSTLSIAPPRCRRPCSVTTPAMACYSNILPARCPPPASAPMATVTTVWALKNVTLEGAHTWRPAGIPYLLVSVPGADAVRVTSASTLTIAPGVEVRSQSARPAHCGNAQSHRHGRAADYLHRCRDQSDARRVARDSHRRDSRATQYRFDAGIRHDSIRRA